MNAARRATLAKAQALIQEARDLIAEAATDERNYYDDMPESLQGSERGCRASEVADALEELDDTLNDVDTALSDACE